MSKFVLATKNRLEGIAIAGHLEEGGHALKVILPEEIADQMYLIRSSHVNLVDLDSVGDFAGDVSREILKLQPNTPIVWLTSSMNDLKKIYNSIASGASGCIGKEDLRALIPSLEKASKGDFLYAKPLLMGFLRQISPMAPPTLLSLNDKESEVLNLVQSGYSNSEIAEHMHISIQFVKRQVAHLKNVFSAKRRRQLSLGLSGNNVRKIVT